MSVNTVHKWVHGVSRPREDNIRALAGLLQVDEVWLALGRTPTPAATGANAGADAAHGAALLVAGLIEVRGGRVTFASASQDVPHFTANFRGDRFDVIAVSPQTASGEALSFVVPEPVGDCRVMAVVAKEHGPVAVLDITKAERHNFGGFSVIELTRDPEGRLHDAVGAVIPVQQEIA
ncbi:helix-turn-helix transcriptional regulator [Sinisalibacter lacisalsi]|uniref:helix-turn-helix transcriptional regulator n=1 Tax=Sinisalibacter lacisalsi TaxID=1526570 RepID=UPI00166C62BD|nr:helix-turn-helix transcriptional regulator [Sinisalibacter lacisalsi]